MLRKFLDWQLSLTEEGKLLAPIKPLITAGDTFLYEAKATTKTGPHIRDAIDIKRWMILVVVALLPCILWGIWNTGIQSLVYSSGNYKLMDEFIHSKSSFGTYFAFALKDGHWIDALKEGLSIFLPLTLVVYVAGGLTEALFAIVRKHEISEGFLVTGILFVLVMPPTIPLWMAAIGVIVGVAFAKEVFGGSGMNIVNPALACRAFLFFAYPGRMSGSVWVGSNPTTVRESLAKMNQEASKGALDGYSQATHLAEFNVTQDIKRIHVDAIATNNLGDKVDHFDLIQKSFDTWTKGAEGSAKLGELTQEQLRNFVTSPTNSGGLGLSPGYYEDAWHFSSLQYGLGENSDWGFFFGDKLGCIGETSTLACLLGALFLIWTGIGSWRTMAAMALGAFLMASALQWGSTLLGADGGAWYPAQFGMPAYKHLLLGGLAFGLVFMATDPVSSPAMKGAKWAYGIMAGIVAITIRVINPAFPEGVMLSILLANVFAPLFDYYAARYYRRRNYSYVRAN